MRNAYRILSGNLKGRFHFGDPRPDGTVVLKWGSHKQDVMIWTGFIWFRIGTSGWLL
jgi:hypothetical protein